MKITGAYAPIERRVTGLYSLDHALSWRNLIGWPMHCFAEIYGRWHVGKSTLTYFISGRLDPKGRVLIADFDGYDPDYLTSVYTCAGFEGDVEIMSPVDDKKKPRSDEAIIQEMPDRLGEAGVVACILDSVTSFWPIGEQKKEIGEALVGRRAFVMAQFARRLRHNLSADRAPHPAAGFIINHPRRIIGGHGSETTGGDTIKDLAAIRIRMWREEPIMEENPKDDFIGSGSVEKLRYGGRGRKFKVALVADRGLHLGMSALFDLIDLGHVERGNTLKLKGPESDKTRSLGYLRAMLDAARSGDDEPFRPVLRAMEDVYKAEGYPIKLIGDPKAEAPTVKAKKVRTARVKGPVDEG